MNTLINECVNFNSSVCLLTSDSTEQLIFAEPNQFVAFLEPLNSKRDNTHCRYVSSVSGGNFLGGEKIKGKDKSFVTLYIEFFILSHEIGYRMGGKIKNSHFHRYVISAVRVGKVDHLAGEPLMRGHKIQKKNLTKKIERGTF